MGKEVHTYSPDEVSVSFKTFRLYGFDDTNFIDAERKEDGFTMHVGVLGDVTRTANLDRTGTITLVLMAESSANDILQAIADLDEKFKNGIGSFQILDHRGNMEIHASKAWIRKRPKVERSKTSGKTTWIFDCADMEVNASGNLVDT